jgi:Flp pilus assembly CpaF family ATPase
MFELFRETVRPVPDPERAGARARALVERFFIRLKERRGELVSPAPAEVAALVRAVLDEVGAQARAEGVELPPGLFAEGLLAVQYGPFARILRIAADPAVEDIALNYGHLWVYRTGVGWEYGGPVDPGVYPALRDLIERAGYAPPRPDYPVADAILGAALPEGDGTRAATVRLRVVMLARPVVPAEAAAIRVVRIGRLIPPEELVRAALPPARDERRPIPEFPGEGGLISAPALRYLIAVLAAGGVVVVAGPTGSGKTTLARSLLQAALDLYPRGALRLFVIEDSPEIVLNGWDGDPAADTGNVVYTVTRPRVPGGPPEVTAYDLIRAALRARPDGIVIGEARGAEAYELIRAAATGHGHSIFTIHAQDLRGVWDRVRQVARAHPDAPQDERTLAADFAEAVTAVVFVARDRAFGQRVRAVAEVARVVEGSRPALNVLFEFDPAAGRLLPRYKPMRPGFTFGELGL